MPFSEGEAVFMRYAVFWNITQRIVAIPYRRFRTNCQSYLQASRYQFLDLEDWTKKWYRNVGNELPLYVA